MIKLGNNNIGKIYLGSNVIGKAYLGSSLVYQAGSNPQPVMVPYIRNSGGAYINTGITPDNTTKVIVWARNFNPNSGTLFGCRVAFGNNAFYIATNTGVNSCRMSINYGNVTEYPEGTQERYLSNYHKYEMNANELLVDDTTIATCDGTFSGNNLNIPLFGINTNGTMTGSTNPIDICACQIYKGGVLVRDYTPVSSPSVGLYDAVSDSVFTNAGSSGSLAYGEFDKNAYTPLEYIESNGSSRFDTGIYGDNNLPFIIKYAPTGTAAWPNIMGARTSNSSKRYELAFGDNATPYSAVYFGYNTGIVSVNNSGSMVGSAYVFVKNNNSFSVYRIQSSGLTSVGTATAIAATFTTDCTIVVGSCNINGSIATAGGSGRISYVGFGTSANFVPAKVGSRIGMYDTYNDIFKESVSSTPFVAGPEL